MGRVVLFRGAFGWNNLGDDIYEQIIRSDMKNKADLILIGKKYYLSPRILLYIWKADLVVLGPGGVFDGRPERFLSDLYIILFTLISKMFRKRTIAYCVQIPTNGLYTRVITRIWLGLLDAVYVRFKKNQEEASSVYNYPFRLCVDIAAILMNRIRQTDPRIDTFIESVYVVSTKGKPWNIDEIKNVMKMIRMAKEVKVDRLHTLMLALLAGARKIRVMPYHWKMLYLIHDYTERQDDYKRVDDRWVEEILSHLP